MSRRRHKNRNKHHHNQTQSTELRPEVTFDGALQQSLINTTFYSTILNVSQNGTNYITNLYQLYFQNRESTDYVMNAVTADDQLNITNIGSENCPHPVLQAEINCPYQALKLIGDTMTKDDILRFFSCDLSPYIPNTENVKKNLIALCDTNRDMLLSILEYLAITAGVIAVGCFVTCLFKHFYFRHPHHARTPVTQPTEENAAPVPFRWKNLLSCSYSSLFGASYKRNQHLQNDNELARLRDDIELSSTGSGYGATA